MPLTFCPSSPPLSSLPPAQATFSSTGIEQNWGTYSMIPQADLSTEANGWKVNDRVIIEVDITTFGALVESVGHSVG